MSYAGPLPPPFPGFVPPTIGQILERIFRLFRANFMVFFKIACVPAAALILLYGLIGFAFFAAGVLAVPARPPDPLKFVVVLVPVTFVAMAVFLMVFAIFEAAGSHAALQANAGIGSSFRAAYTHAWKNAGRFIWLMFLRYLCVGVPILVCYAVIGGLTLALIAGAGKTHPGVFFAVAPLMFLAYTGAMVYAIFMSIRLALAAPACLAEQLPATVALKRSLHLTRNAKGRIFVVMLAIYAAAYIAFMILEAVCCALIAGALLIGATLHIHLGGPVIAAMTVLGLVVLAAVFLWMAALAATYAIAFAVLYHDQCMRMEGASPMPVIGEPA